MKTRVFVRALGFFVLSLVAVLASVWFLLLRPSVDIREFWAVESGLKTNGTVGNTEKKDTATKYLEVGRRHPGSIGGISALLMAATKAPESEPGQEANRRLAQEIETAEIGKITSAFDRGVQGNWKLLKNLAPTFLSRARRNLENPEAARLLDAVCVSTQPEEDGEPPPIYKEAADLIADKYASSPEIVHFCEGLRGGGRWAVAYERHLRAILKANPDRFVRCSAHYALATVVQSTSEDRQSEAEELFNSFLKDFDGKHNHQAIGIEQQYRAEAQRHLDELRSHALGLPAPEIDGVDIYDKPMKLSDFRGRVVLMSFWATWCYPCMKFIPHELELAKSLEGQPFQIVGVNSDSEIKKAQDAVEKTKMSWRSFRDIVDDRELISKQWGILGYPTFYLIDHHGTIRKRWLGYPPIDALTHATRVLVEAAKRNVPLTEMRQVVSEMNVPTAKPSEAPIIPIPSLSSSGFIEKVYRAPDGLESKYVMFVPRTYDGSKPFPLILFLHGSGSRGTDGQLPIKYGLAKTIRAKNEEFPFIVVFPQAREGENWLPDNAGGQRALAILDRTEKEYKVDADRVTLTGISMGGEGTWGLAIAHPDRWASIVPLCHGGDMKLAARLKDIPCWCFHGDADKMIPVQASREMVKAIKEAGGHPLYQEFIGVGHDDLADRAYSLPDLFEWMLLQDRKQK